MRTGFIASLAALLMLLTACGAADTPSAAFGVFDDDADELITQEEFQEDIDRFDTAVTFDEVDADDDLSVTEEEFAEFDDEFGDEGLATTSFEIFDDDEDALIDAFEYDEEALDRFGSETLFEDIDANDDLSVTEDEFGVFEDEFGFGL